MELKQVTQDILKWSENFLEQPHPALGNWSPCPYARRARLNYQVDVRIGSDPYHDLENLCSTGLGNSQVVIYAYDPTEWTKDIFVPRITAANQDFLLASDMIVLEDHPDEPEIVNGVCMNQGNYALAMCQSLSDLNAKSLQLAQKGYYHNWPRDYLQDLFEGRVDPTQS